MTEFNRPYYFNLFKDGDSAVVRILHKDTSTIEVEKLYTIELDGKKRKLKVNGDDKLLQDKGMKPYDRMFLHVWDYTEKEGNPEKVWDRTMTIMPQLEKLQESWNPLHSAVVKITRKGDDFPKYEIEPQNFMNYEQVNEKLIDTEVAKYFHLHRKTDDIKVFLETGKFPEREPYLSKEEYAAKKKAEENQQKENTEVKETTTNTAVAEPVKDEFDDLPF